MGAEPAVDLNGDNQRSIWHPGRRRRWCGRTPSDDPRLPDAQHAGSLVERSHLQGRRLPWHGRVIPGQPGELVP